MMEQILSSLLFIVILSIHVLMFMIGSKKMDKVYIDKDVALARLRENRSHHRELFEKALDGWKDRVKKEIDRIAKELESNRMPDVFIRHQPPVDYTSEYDTAIEMLELSQDPEVELSFKDFKNFMRDEWNWKRDFISSNSHYAAEAYAAEVV